MDSAPPPQDTAAVPDARPEGQNDRLYDAIATGLTGYWYPINWARRIRKPYPVRILDREIVLIPDQGKIYAFDDRCPHRGVPLSIGRQELPGTWACRYHGWVFDLASGVVRAVLTDGPDSPLCGRARVQAFPVEQRLGLVWVYVGEGPPPPLEADIPQELLAPDMMMLGRFSIQRGNWRYACENAFDEGHFKYLHRYGSFFAFFKEFPAWSTVKITEKDGWISRDVETIAFADDYKGFGHWPPKPWWKRRHGGSRLSMRLPGIMCNEHLGTGRSNYSWYVPIGKDQYHYLQFYVMSVRGVRALWFYLLFWGYLRWAHFIQFNNQDSDMVEKMPETAPWRLYRPDVAIFAWRKLCETARQFTK